MSVNKFNSFARALATNYGVDIKLTRTFKLAGGDVNKAYGIELSNGIDIFMKITEALDVSADWLLRTNTSNVKSIQNHEALDVLTDCTAQETEIILKLMKDIKAALRSVENKNS